jgi:hypothetical protein
MLPPEPRCTLSTCHESIMDAKVGARRSNLMSEKSRSSTWSPRRQAEVGPLIKGVRMCREGSGGGADGRSLKSDRQGWDLIPLIVRRTMPGWTAWREPVQSPTDCHSLVQERGVENPVPPESRSTRRPSMGEADSEVAGYQVRGLLQR